MIDPQNPTEQFHPYQEPDAIPNTGSRSWLSKLGLDQTRMRSVTDAVSNTNLRSSVDKARGYAAANPGKVLGGLAALVIGAGLMRGRSRR